MKVNKGLILFSFIALLVVASSCNNSKRTTTAAFYNFEIQYIRAGMQGDIQVKVFAEGHDEAECKKQAKYEAVKTLIFKGIAGAPSSQPLVSEVGAEEKYKQYFSNFFSEEGKYLDFVSLSKDGAVSKNDILKVGNRLKIGVQVVVQKENLILELKRNGIIQ